MATEASFGIEKWLRLVPGQSLESLGNFSFENLYIGHYEARILLLIASWQKRVLL